MGFGALDHIGISVRDLGRSAGWYTRLLGTEPHLRKRIEPGYVGEIVGYAECRMEWALFRLPNETMLELIEYEFPPPAEVDMETYNVGNSHLCLVTDDIAAVYERMRDHAEFRSPEPVTVPYGPYQGAQVCYLRDPDGISVEVMQAPPDSDGASSDANR